MQISLECTRSREKSLVVDPSGYVPEHGSLSLSLSFSREKSLVEYHPNIPRESETTRPNERVTSKYYAPGPLINDNWVARLRGRKGGRKHAFKRMYEPCSDKCLAGKPIARSSCEPLLQNSFLSCFLSRYIVFCLRDLHSRD